MRICVRYIRKLQTLLFLDLAFVYVYMARHKILKTLYTTLHGTLKALHAFILD